MEDIQIISDTFLNTGLEHKPQGSIKKSQVVFAVKPNILYFDEDRDFSQKITSYLSTHLNADIKRVSSYQKLQEILPAMLEAGPFGFMFHATPALMEDAVLFLELLKQKRCPHFVLALSGHGMVSQMIKLAENDLFHYMITPFALPVLADSLVKCFAQKVQLLISETSKAAEWKDTQQADHFFSNQIFHANISTHLQQEDSLGNLVGKSSIMRLLFDRIARAASQDTPIYLCGERGTGKRAIAKVIHQLSSRNGKAIGTVNCRSLSPSILDYELFGHATSTTHQNQLQESSLLELSNHSSLLLNEIDYLPKSVQEKLLKFSQTKQLNSQIGGKSLSLNVRLILSGEKNLEKLVLEGKFKEDFLFSLGHTLIKVPSLRERKEDIALLIAHFVRRYSAIDKSNAIVFSGASIEMLMKYEWPGNVAELEELIKQLVIYKGASTINPEDMPVSIHSPKVIQVGNLKDQIYLPESGINLKKLISDVEDTLIMQAINRTNGNKHKAAQLLGLNRTTLIEKMKKKKLNL